MSGTFSQVYVQIVFAVKGRDNLIGKQWKDELYKYIAGIIRGKEQKPIIVNGMPDHIHAFVGLRGRFSWQEGCIFIFALTARYSLQIYSESGTAS